MHFWVIHLYLYGVPGDKNDTAGVKDKNDGSTSLG